MCLILLHFQPCAGSEPDCNCCLSNKYTYMQLRSPEVTGVNFHLSDGENERTGDGVWVTHLLAPVGETLRTCAAVSSRRRKSRRVSLQRSGGRMCMARTGK